MYGNAVQHVRFEVPLESEPNQALVVEGKALLRCLRDFANLKRVTIEPFVTSDLFGLADEDPQADEALARGAFKQVGHQVEELTVDDCYGEALLFYAEACPNIRRLSFTPPLLMDEDDASDVLEAMNMLQHVEHYSIAVYTSARALLDHPEDLSHWCLRSLTLDHPHIAFQSYPFVTMFAATLERIEISSRGPNPPQIPDTTVNLPSLRHLILSCNRVDDFVPLLSFFASAPITFLAFTSSESSSAPAPEAIPDLTLLRPFTMFRQTLRRYTCSLTPGQRVLVTEETEDMVRAYAAMRNIAFDLTPPRDARPAENPFPPLTNGSFHRDATRARLAIETRLQFALREAARMEAVGDTVGLRQLFDATDDLKEYMEDVQD